jgi:hypothetical protein
MLRFAMHLFRRRLVFVLGDGVLRKAPHDPLQHFHAGYVFSQARSVHGKLCAVPGDPADDLIQSVQMEAGSLGGELHLVAHDGIVAEFAEFSRG